MRLQSCLAILGLTLAAAASVRAADAVPAPPAVGDMAPVFALMSDEGKTVNLSDYRGRWVVLYFYPKDFTSGCTLEAHNFQQDLPMYEANNAAILGVSVDTADSHKSFCTKEGLSFRLLSDPGAKVSTAYGSVMEHEGQTYSARHTFLIDPKGKIARVYLDVKPATHSKEVFDTIRMLAAK
jgi:thioredoxin-dependent peroxiredoxin